ncbi:MAG: acyl-CoA thioesterase [Chloroflexota bacterium]|nr:acyl-CoA thioesterase [Chloroflexota bacterium]MDQ5865072.1 acyl-CoA thioesterase [Chloroflexota bacterium]
MAPTPPATFRRRDFGDPPPLTPRPMSASLSMVSQVMLPNDANPMGNVHGGSIMKMVDIGAAVAAMRHCGRQVVTVALDHMSFLAPVFIGDLVTITSQVEYVGSTSMLVRVTVDAENPASGRKMHTSSCVLTFVALDENNRPVPVPPLLAETPEEEERLAEGKRVYESAKAERTRQAQV